MGDDRMGALGFARCTLRLGEAERDGRLGEAERDGFNEVEST
jgi:hypothetical protein